MSACTVSIHPARCRVVLAGVLLSACATLAVGQTLKAVQTDPATISVMAGLPANVIAEFDLREARNCNVRVSWGDGKVQDVRIHRPEQARLVLTHAFMKPGDYTVTVDPKTRLPLLKCIGQAKTAKVTVTPPPAPNCPPGWAAERRGPFGTGGFDCRALKRGLKPPAERPACPPPLKAHDDPRRGRFGCRP